MKRSSKYAVGITSAVMVGTLAFGAVASAGNGNGEGDGSGNGTGGRRDRRHAQLTEEQRCQYGDRIEASINMFQEHLTDRIANLETWRAEAEANGDTALVERLTQRLDRLATVQTRAQERLQTFQDWTTEHCPVDTTS